MEPSGLGECGRLGGVSFGLMLDKLFLKFDCGGRVFGLWGGAARPAFERVCTSSAVSMVVGKSTNFCWIPGPMSAQTEKIDGG